MTESKTPYDATIDGEKFLVDPNLRPGARREGEIAYDVDEDPKHFQGPHPRDDVLHEDPDLSAAMVPIPSTETPQFKGIPRPGTFRLCKNDRCNEFVPPSLNPGIERLFCSRRCSHNYHNRQYERTRRTKAGWFLELHRATGEQLQMLRTKPKNIVQAERRYKSHLNREVCPNADKESRGRCPSHAYQDYYSKRRLCLPYAVLVDDLYEQLAKSRGELYLRQWTSDDGLWVEQSRLPHMEHTLDKKGEQ